MRRFCGGLSNLLKRYIPLANRWRIFDNCADPSALVASDAHLEKTVALLWRKNGKISTNSLENGKANFCCGRTRARCSEEIREGSQATCAARQGAVYLYPKEDVVCARIVLRELTSEERKGWSFFAGRTTATQSEYAQHMGVTARTAQRHLTHFVELGMLRRRGQGPATKYEVVRA